MTYKRGTIKLFTFSFEKDAPNIINCALQLSAVCLNFGSAHKNFLLVVQVLPSSNLNSEPWIDIKTLFQ